MDMRRFAITSIALVLASVPATADEKKGEPPTVRALDVKIEGMISVKFGDPTVIADAEQLAKVIKDEATVTTINKAVDFKTERILYFAWSGSGQDKVTFTTAEGKKGLEVTFAYTPGRTKDERWHKKLFAIPKDAAFKVVAP